MLCSCLQVQAKDPTIYGILVSKSGSGLLLIYFFIGMFWADLNDWDRGR